MTASTHTHSNASDYKWYVLTLAALTHSIVVGIPMMSMPVLFDEIAKELGLNLVEIGWIWGIGFLTGIFTSLIGGALGDRFGPKRTLMVGCFLAGITGALRGLSGDFVTLAAAAFLFGLLPQAIPMNVHKTCGVWFSGRHLGLANGVVATGMALGFTLAMAMIGAMREVLGAGTLLGFRVMPLGFEPWAIMLLPPGGFFSLAVLLTLFAWVRARIERRRDEHALRLAGGGARGGAV